MFSSVRRMILVVLCMVVGSIGSMAGAAEAGSPVMSTCCAQQNLVVVSWDGAHPLVVTDMLSRKQLPVLQSLLNQGAQWQALNITDQLPTYPTETMPGHSQMLTGQPWTATGVKSNTEWTVIPTGLTLPEKWKAAGTWVGWDVQKPQLGQYLYDPQCPTCPPPVDPRGPFWNVWQVVDYTIENDAGTPMDAVNAGLSGIASSGGQRFFLLIHSSHPDTEGHKYGAGSAKYKQALIDNDTALGVLLANLPAGTQLIITTDHAFGADKKGGCPPNKGTSHDVCPYSWVVSWPTLTLAGSRLLDLAPALQP